MSDLGPIEGVVNAFLNAILADRRAGRVLTLAEYQARWPGAAEAIAAEYRAFEIGADEPQAQISIGRFRLVRELGRGGQGVVYAAVDPTLDRTVALKVLGSPLGLHRDVMERFRREAKLTATLCNSGIASAYDVGETGGVAWIAMALVPGRSLAELIRGRSPGSMSERTTSSSDGGGVLESPTSIARFLASAAQVLHHAHAAGVVHRDVKPGNIMVTPEGTPVLLDFGLARPTRRDSTTLTLSGDRPGTPAYMSPERLAGAEATVASDVWSLGVTLYEMLEGRRPFEGATEHELICRIAESDPPPLRDTRSRVAASLVIVLRTALSKDPARRYRDAAQFASDLEAACDGRCLAARAPSVADRLRELAHRHRHAIRVAMLIVVTAAVASGFVLLLQARNAETERRKLATGALRVAIDRSTAEPYPEIELLEIFRSLSGATGNDPLLAQALDGARRCVARAAYPAAEAIAREVLRHRPAPELERRCHRLIFESRLFHLDPQEASIAAGQLRKSDPEEGRFAQAALDLVGEPCRIPMSTVPSATILTICRAGSALEVYAVAESETAGALQLLRWRPGDSVPKTTEVQVSGHLHKLRPTSAAWDARSAHGQTLLVTLDDNDAREFPLLEIRLGDGEDFVAVPTVVARLENGAATDILSSPSVQDGWDLAIVTSHRRRLELLDRASGRRSILDPRSTWDDDDTVALRAWDLDADGRREIVGVCPGHHAPGLFRIQLPNETGEPKWVDLIEGLRGNGLLDLDGPRFISTSFQPPELHGPPPESRALCLIEERSLELTPVWWPDAALGPRTSVTRLDRIGALEPRVLAAVSTWASEPPGVLRRRMTAILSARDLIEAGTASGTQGATVQSPLRSLLIDAAVVAVVGAGECGSDDQWIIESHGDLVLMGSGTPSVPSGWRARETPTELRTQILADLARVLIDPGGAGDPHDAARSALEALVESGDAEIAEGILERWLTPADPSDSVEAAFWESAREDMDLVLGQRIAANALPRAPARGLLVSSPRRVLEFMAYGPPDAVPLRDRLDDSDAPGRMQGEREIRNDAIAEGGREGSKGYAVLAGRCEPGHRSAPEHDRPETRTEISSRDPVWDGVRPFRLRFEGKLRRLDYSMSFRVSLGTGSEKLEFNIPNARDSLGYDGERSVATLTAGGFDIESGRDIPHGFWCVFELAHVPDLHLLRLTIRRSGRSRQEAPEVRLFARTRTLRPGAYRLTLSTGGRDAAAGPEGSDVPRSEILLDDVVFETFRPD